MTLEVLAAADEAILSPAALGLVERLHDELEPRRRLELLERRHERQRELDAGARPAFVTSTAPATAGRSRPRRPTSATAAARSPGRPTAR